MPTMNIQISLKFHAASKVLRGYIDFLILSCDGHQLYDFKVRGVDLEVEGVRYIDMHRGPAAYVLGPPPSRGRDLELEGGVNVMSRRVRIRVPRLPRARYRVMASVLVKLRFRLGRVTQKPLAHCTAR